MISRPAILLSFLLCFSCGSLIRTIPSPEGGSVEIVQNGAGGSASTVGPIPQPNNCTAGASLTVAQGASIRSVSKLLWGPDRKLYVGYSNATLSGEIAVYSSLDVDADSIKVLTLPEKMQLQDFAVLPDGTLWVIATKTASLTANLVHLAANGDVLASVSNDLLPLESPVTLRNQDALVLGIQGVNRIIADGSLGPIVDVSVSLPTDFVTHSKGFVVTSYFDPRIRVIDFKSGSVLNSAGAKGFGHYGFDGNIKENNVVGGPTDVDVDLSENIYVTDPTFPRILKYNSNLEYVSELRLTPGGYALRLAVMSEKQTIVIARENRVEIRCLREFVAVAD